MKFNQYTWNLYKQSPEGQKAIKEFEDAARNISMYDLILKYNRSEAEFTNKNNIEECCETLWVYGFEGIIKPTNLQEAEKAYETLIDAGVHYGQEDPFIDKGDYKTMLAANLDLSFLFYFKAPEYFIPNLFRYRFFDLNKIADTFEINLPPTPKKPDYKARCMTYWYLCETLYNFRTENGLSPAELCAFLYDFAPNFIFKEKTDIPQPTQAWFIGGKIEDYERALSTTFWQANPETKKGDILIHYETSPISAITCIWIAQTDGVIDPFFHYYSNTYIGNKIDIPHITLKELQTNEYFSKHPLIRKKFQGVNGWPMSSEDYSQLLRMIAAKGFDIDNLPKLYAPTLPANISIALERDVETKLLEPLLNSMEWFEDKDFIRQLPIHAGRGHRVFPDYALHYDNKPDYEKARVLLEAKLLMRNNQDIEEAFKQARSYANILESSAIVLCDKTCLIVYEKADSFDRDKYTKYYWTDFENPDRFNELKNRLRDK